MHAVILQHVGHILGVHEGIVQADDLYIVMSQGGAEDEAANAAEAIDANLGFHIGKTPFTKSDAPGGAPSKRLRKRFLIIAQVYYHTVDLFATVNSDNIFCGRLWIIHKKKGIFHNFYTKQGEKGA